MAALHAEGLDPPSPRAPQTLAELLERLARVRRERFAISEEEALRGVCGIAAAVGDPATGEAVALGIVCPAATTEAGERAAIARAPTPGPPATAEAARSRPSPTPLSCSAIATRTSSRAGG